jgi:hypothetical protein
VTPIIWVIELKASLVWFIRLNAVFLLSAIPQSLQKSFWTVGRDQLVDERLRRIVGTVDVFHRLFDD